MPNKLCKTCGTEFLPVTNKVHCSESCRLEHHRKLRQEEYYSDHDENKERNKALSQQARDKDPLRYVYKGRKSKAKAQGIEFTIKYSDVIQPDICPILKTPFERHTWAAASIDRIDNNKGYTPDNIQVISRKANVMKNSASPEEMLKFADWVYATYG